MKKLLHSHSNFIIGTFAIMFLVILIGFYLWAVNDAVTQLRSALITPPSESVSGFDLESASHLDLRGVVNINTSTSGN